MEEELFPTIFAKSIGEKHKLIPKSRKGMSSSDHSILRERIEMMVCFQQMAMACSLDDCMIAFHGIKLNATQIQNLGIIHKSTRPWILGNNTATLLKKLQSPMLSGKDAKDMTAAIVEHLQEKDISGPEGRRKAEFRVVMASGVVPD